MPRPLPAPPAARKPNRRDPAKAWAGAWLPRGMARDFERLARQAHGGKGNVTAQLAHEIERAVSQFRVAQARKSANTLARNGAKKFRRGVQHQKRTAPK